MFGAIGSLDFASFDANHPIGGCFARGGSLCLWHQQNHTQCSDPPTRRSYATLVPRGSLSHVRNALFFGTFVSHLLRPIV
jgi:hypothetical protein